MYSYEDYLPSQRLQEGGGGQHPVTGVLYTVMPDVASIVSSVTNVE
jgi:hypothetical protein